MGKKLDILLGRNLNTSKFKALVNHAVSRIAVLKNQRQARYSLARSDVVQLLNLGHHDRALLRVEQVIKEQNRLDAFVMIEGYCHLLVERIYLIQEERVCPEELKEAVSSLVYAATRCGECPELQKMRKVFTSRFGKEIVSRAIELRNNCGVNPKMVRKLSTRPTSLENRLKVVLKEIASENNIVLQNEEEPSVATEEKFKKEQLQNHAESSDTSGESKHCDDFHNLQNGIDIVEGLSVLLKGTRKYKDVADAAEEAFKSAAYAAAAARAAVELSKSKSRNPNDHNSARPVTDKNNLMKFEVQNTEENNLRRIKDQKNVLGFRKVHPIQSNHSVSEDEIHDGEKDEETKEGRRVAHSRPLQGFDFYGSDGEVRNERGEEQVSRIHELGFAIKHSLNINEGLGSGKFQTNQDDDLSETESTTLSQSQKMFSLRSQAGLKTESVFENTKADSSEGSRIQSSYQLNAGRRPISVRTRRAQRCREAYGSREWLFR